MARFVSAAFAVLILTNGLLHAESPVDDDASEVAAEQVVSLDVNAVLRTLPNYQKQMQAFQRDVHRSEATLSKDRNEINQLAIRLKAAKPDSKEAESLRQELRDRETNLVTIAELQRKEFISRELKIYQEHYQKVVAEVDSYAKENNVSIVLRGERTVPPKQQQTQPQPHQKQPPQSQGQIISAGSSPVVWASDSADITQKIIDRLTPKPDARRSTASPATAGDSAPPAAAPGQRQGSWFSKFFGGGKSSADASAAKKGDASPAADPGRSAQKKPTVIRIRLHGEYPEGVQSHSIFGNTQVSLLALMQRFEKTAADKSVAAVILDIDGLDIGSARAYEICQAIARLRKAGKPVYAILSSAEMREYLVASACNEVVMVPAGMLTIPGVRAEVTFFKGLLDKLGLTFESMQMGKYKGAMEAFTRAEMSPSLRESMEAVVDDSFDAAVTAIAANRKLDEDRVKRLIDRGLFTASAAKESGLIDQTAYPDEFLESLRKKLGADSLNVVYPEKQKTSGVEVDLSGVGGMVKMMELVIGRKGSAGHTSGKQIAVVYAIGPIVEAESERGLFAESTVAPTTIIEALQTASKDPKVAAIVLRIDSPGGSAIASDLIWREVCQSKKPVIASMGDVAGSGGYYIAMGAKKIFAEPTTITGSIGVIGGKLVVKGLYDKLGITTDVIVRGKNSGVFSPTSPLSDGERAAMHDLLSDTYDQFVGKAAQGRRMPRKQLQKLAQGRIYTGQMAAANGLIDRVGTLHDAIVEAKQAAGLKADDKVDLLILPKPKSVFEQLFAEPSVSSKIFGGLQPAADLLAHAETLRRMFTNRILILMPYQVRLK
jgi:protease-4